MDAALDRLVFHRPDYGSLLTEIGSAIQQHIEPQSLISYVTNTVQATMVAESAVFSLSNTEPESALRNRQSDTAVVPVQAGRRWFGRLHVGKRSGGRMYMSEDLAFLDKVAAHTAGMLQNIELREERELQSRREQQLKELASQAELRALKAQINPHFLYNALNGLAQLTREIPEAAEKSILDLSKVFRYALSASERDSVKLEEEADFLESYLAIEQMRFEERLRFRIDIPEELRECAIPPMIIQPLVENAVIHGISPKIAGGRILVAARRIDSKLCICVEDDGAGFDCRDCPPDNGGIGLQNVRMRIRTLDPANNVHIDSKPGVGTKVTLEIPI
jgi:two-component system, LytTR family, sensor kinase